MKGKILASIFALVLISCGSSDLNIEGEWLEPIPGMETQMQGIRIEPKGIAVSVNMATLQYESWKLNNDKLILTGKSIGNGTTSEFADTMTVIKNTSDSLILENSHKYIIRYSRKH